MLGVLGGGALLCFDSVLLGMDPREMFPLLMLQIFYYIHTMIMPSSSVNWLYLLTDLRALRVVLCIIRYHDGIH